MNSKKPLVELHRHLDGSVRIQTILDLAREHKIPLPADTVKGLKPFVQVTERVSGVLAFIARFEWMQRVMVDMDAVRRIAYENIADAAAEGIDYIELRFSPYFMAEKHRLDMVELVRTVCEGVRQGEVDYAIKANLIGIMSRTFGVDRCWDELNAILKGREQSLIGIDLAGDEVNFPGRLFIRHLDKAREAGLHVTIHAGEMAPDSHHAGLGVENLWVAVRDQGAERLGHALRAVDDPALMDTIAERGIGIESCPTSNVQTGVVHCYADHPLRTFVERDLLVTLNTDDPGISNITLQHEYEIAGREIGLTMEQLEKLRENARRVAFAHFED